MGTAIALMLPFIGTTAGAACVFFLKKQISMNLQRVFTGFAAGVMVAASVWSLLIPAMDMSESMGKFAFFPALVGFLLGIVFLLFMDNLIPHLHVAQRPPLDQTVRMVLALVKIIFARFGHHLRIDVTRLRLTVATGDAAGTAILWGAVCPAVGALLEILDRITNLRTLKHCEIDVQPDFTAETFSADVCIAFSLCVWQVFDIALRALFGFIRHRALPQTPAQSKPKA